MCICLCPLSRWDNKTGIKCPLPPIGFMLRRLVVTLSHSVSKRKPGWFKREAVLTNVERQRLQYRPARTEPWCRSIEGSAVLFCCLDRNLCLLKLFIFLWGAWQMVACIDRHRWLHQWCLMWRSVSWPDRDPKTDLSLPACCGVSLPRLPAPDKSALIQSTPLPQATKTNMMKEWPVLR